MWLYTHTCDNKPTPVISLQQRYTHSHTCDSTLIHVITHSHTFDYISEHVTIPPPGIILYCTLLHMNTLTHATVHSHMWLYTPKCDNTLTLVTILYSQTCDYIHSQMRLYNIQWHMWVTIHTVDKTLSFVTTHSHMWLCTHTCDILSHI